MASPYEVEHGIKPSTTTKPTRRPSMSSFFAQLSQIETTNPHAQPTPVEVSAAERLLQDQLTTLRLSAPTESNQALLTELISAIEMQIEHPPEKAAGVPQSYLDELDRVPKKLLKKTDTCPICGEAFLDDDYPLVVQLPCHKTHRFDLDCVGPWLRMQGTCPLDRKELMKKKEIPKPVEDDEEEDDGGMYA
ncbi:putative RING finger protein [Lachnellula subtilissima]|uniref:Putative RING finger protein n=1 Tax=Lachnellula subtilissima TaxID=602034 RepID=A0A8H8UA40_9HELO|nr:putative RING finger protein [Lachnellula subtilissima]